MNLAGKSIMIFGAGLNQLELIREAKKLGLTTVVVDPAPDPPGRLEADYFYRIEGADYNTTKSVAITHNVKGIVTGQMEKPLRLMARLADEMGFIFNSPEVTERCIDKWLMKETFIKHNVPCARGMLVRSGEKIPGRLHASLKFPLIIKPRDAFSSRGVYRCETLDELASHAAESKRWSSKGDILIEEFLEGKEYSVEAVTYKGITTIIQDTEKFITPYPNTVETGHLQPAALSCSEKESVSLLVKDAIRALGIENSASHTEVMLTKDGPRVIETGARLGGDFISSYLTRSSTGVSMDRAAVQIAMGVEPDAAVRSMRYSMIRYIELPAGKTVHQVLDASDISREPGVVFMQIFVRPGNITEPLTHSAQRPACILVEAETRDDLLLKAEKYSKLLSERIILT